MGSQHILGSHLCHLLRVIAEVAQADNRIVPVIVNIRKGGKRQVAANSRRLFVGHASHLKGILWIPGRADFHRMSNQSAIHTGSVAACLRVAGNDQGNLGIFL